MPKIQERVGESKIKINMLNKFTPDVCKRLGYYVYRLIDPRTGQTFYVGKGKNNRVFAHAQDALKDYDGVDYFNAEQDDDISAKIQQIRDIHNAGLEVIMVIHRWGMDEATAYEVESALTDCYPGLTNEQSGHDSDRGVANVDTIQRVLGLEEFDDSKAEPNEYMIIKIKQESLDLHNGNIYDTARSAWAVNPQRAQACKYILVSLYGEVVAIFKDAQWKSCPTVVGRFEFNAIAADPIADANIIDSYLHKLLPERYMKKGVQAPFLYQSKK